MSKQVKKKLPSVVLVGRTNVGKSTLFNRLTGKRHALISPEPGTTRDRREAEVEWNGVIFTMVDTGGIEGFSKESQTHHPFAEAITNQAEQALANADLVMLVVSATDGIMPQDKEWAKRLRGDKRILLIVNKVDSTRREGTLPDFFKLGIGQPLAVSAHSGRLSGDLLDTITEKLRTKKSRKETQIKAEKETLRMTILGQPNSGKSTLINTIVGEERMISSPLAHTTRESQDISFAFFGKQVVLIDTAGIRRRAVRRGSKKAKTSIVGKLETQGVTAAMRSATEADVVILLIDVMQGPTVQDQRLAQAISKEGRAVILVVNKWDTVKNKTATSKNETEQAFRRLLPGLDWAPMLFISAKTKLRARQVLQEANDAASAWRRRINEETLKTFVTDAVSHHRPARGGGVRHPRILHFHQTDVAPPRFILTVAGELHPSYLSYIENRLREQFDFTGSPIHITLKSVRKRYGQNRKK